MVMVYCYSVLYWLYTAPAIPLINTEVTQYWHERSALQSVGIRHSPGNSLYPSHGGVFLLSLLLCWFSEQSFPPRIGLKERKMGTLNRKINVINFWKWKILKWSTLEPKILELKGSSYGNRPSIYVLKGCYDETSQKVVVTVILGLVILKRRADQG